MNEGEVEVLFELSRRKPNLKNRIDPRIEQSVQEYAIEFSVYGPIRASIELREPAVVVSPVGIRGIWIRHQLANIKNRLKALEPKVAADGLVLTESQVLALE